MLVSFIRFYNNINVFYSVVGGKLLDFSILLFYFCSGKLHIHQMAYMYPGLTAGRPFPWVSGHFHSAGGKVYNEFIDMYGWLLNLTVPQEPLVYTVLPFSSGILILLPENSKLER